jgi:hypothetical protein
MKHQKLIMSFIVISTLSSLTACSHNPALSVDSDTFAKAVNSYEDKDIGNDGIAQNCGMYYAYPDKNIAPFLAQNLEQSCPNSIAKLAVYLNQDSHFQGITEQELETKDTWLHYFQSKYARGK